MAKLYKKIIVDGKLLKVFPMEDENDYPTDIEKLINLKGIEILPATPADFLADYERRYGLPIID